MPHLWQLVERGVHAAWMTPSFPSLTFPNHYTLVTGLQPDHHGIVHNSMQDAAISGGFTMHNVQAVADGRWWDDGEPIWVTAERNGIVTATMFWPGSEAEIHAIRPHYWRPFNSALPINERVGQVLNWLDLPHPSRPRFITLYFDQVDHAEHLFGPDSVQRVAAMAQVDTGIGMLLDGLRRRGLSKRVDIVVVSDHGMAATSPDRVTFIEDLVDPSITNATTTGQLVGFVPKPGHETEVETQLLKLHPHVACYRKDATPPRWRYGTHRRIPPLLCQADEGWTMTHREELEKRRMKFDLGAHGFDNELPSMRATFIAAGPDIRHESNLPATRSVEVYPLLCALLGIPPRPNDADGSLAKAILRSPERAQNKMRTPDRQLWRSAP
jgi:predicted AlkP superfamily pyrophosphatase or phosphodiesterase